jgi:hypothetical protein
MQLWRFHSTHRGALISAYLVGILVAGPAGCNNVNLGGTVGTNPANPFGFLINSDPGGKTLGGVRLLNDSAVWAYGEFNPDGSIKNISGAVLRDGDGNLTEITFVNGLPSKARGPDGSTLEATYSIRTETRLAGHVDLFFAGVPDADAHQTINFDVDLQRAADQLAQQIEQLTGLNVSNEAPPPKPADTGGRPQITDAAQSLYGKDAAQSQLLLYLWGPAYVFAFASLGYILVQVMAEVVKLVIDLYVGVIVALTESLVIAVTAPFIVLGDIMRQSADQPLTLLNLALAQHDGHLNLPPPPDL